MQAHQAIHQSRSHEWYTPPEYCDAVHQVMDAIDLDPASCEAANRYVRAATYFTKTEDGLTQPWHGRGYLNPPYGFTGSFRQDGTWNPKGGQSNAEVWTQKLLHEWQQGHLEQAILLVNAVPGAKWFLPLFDFPICFTDHRIRFIDPTGRRQPQPTHSNAFVYLGPAKRRFYAVFHRFGNVVERVCWAADTETPP
jgi:ParB family chromosome partitioning protein